MPTIQLTDKEIDQLIQIPKVLPINYSKLLRFRAKSTSVQHEEAQIDVKLESGDVFRLMIRKNLINPFDFSVILGYVPKDVRTCCDSADTTEFTNIAIESSPCGSVGSMFTMLHSATKKLDGTWTTMLCPLTSMSRQMKPWRFFSRSVTSRSRMRNCNPSCCNVCISAKYSL